MTIQEFTTRYTYNPQTDKLGEGGFGSVFKAYDTYRDRWVAIKIAKVNPDFENVRLRKEVEMISQLSIHPNVAYYEECHSFILHDGEYDYGILQYYEEGNLLQLLKKEILSEEQKYSILEQILEGLQFLHNNNIIHRDLKPQNILIVKRGDEYIPKITDFGISKKLDVDKSSVFSNSLVGAGTLAYSSPEQLNEVSIRKNTDLWSFGVITYQVLTGQLPFSTGEHSSSSQAGRIELFRQINSGQLPDTISFIPDSWQTLIVRCLVVDARKRIENCEGAINLLVKDAKEDTMFDNQWTRTTEREFQSTQTSFDRTTNTPNIHRKKTICGNVALSCGISAVFILIIIFVFQTGYPVPLTMLISSLIATVAGMICLVKKKNRKKGMVGLILGLIPIGLIIFENYIAPNIVYDINQDQSNLIEYSISQDNQTFTVKGVSFEMISVQGGTFTMGCTSEQGADCFDWEKPAHQVTLSNYYMGKFEVTQELWQAVMGGNPSYFKGAQLPVEKVSWDDAQDFIVQLNRLSGKTFRLPTEAEWEFAARGGTRSTNHKYSGASNLDNCGWYEDNSGSTTHPVGSKVPNELGIYDMSGNVWEWCSDWYGDYNSTVQTNPKGASWSPNRVLRGGGWDNISGYCRSAHRYGTNPDYRSSNFGFRLALSL